MPDEPIQPTPPPVQPAVTQPPPPKPDTSPAPPQQKKVTLREPKLCLTETQKIISNLEPLLSSKVLCYFTPTNCSINQSHPDIFLEQLRRIGPQERISLIVVSNGGDSSASLRIATIVREYCKFLQIIVPSRCASAATVLALAADKIIMCPSGYLTAIDTSLTHGLNPKDPNNEPVSISVDQIKRILRMLNEEGPAVTNDTKEGSYRTLFKYIHPIAIGEIDRISSRTILIATKMMNMHPGSFPDQDKIKWIAEHLYNDYPEHGFPILFNEAHDIGLPVEKANMELTDLLRNLINNYDTATDPTTTHFSENHFHFSSYTNLVESVGTRTVFRNFYDKVLNQISKRWQTENDLSRWVNITPGEKQEDPISISALNIAAGQEKNTSVNNQD